MNIAEGIADDLVSVYESRRLDNLQMRLIYIEIPSALKLDDLDVQTMIAPIEVGET